MTHTTRIKLLKNSCRIFFLILTALLPISSNGQGMRFPDTGSRDSRILKIIGYQDLSLEQLRAMPIGQLKFPQIPLLPYPKEDVQRIKVTRDSIPVLVFNPLHKDNLPVIIQYHGGGFISPLVPGLEYSLWQDARTTRRWCLRWITASRRSIDFPRRSMTATRAFVDIGKRAAVWRRREQDRPHGKQRGSESGGSDNTASEEGWNRKSNKTTGVERLAGGFASAAHGVFRILLAECKRLFPNEGVVLFRGGDLCTGAVQRPGSVTDTGSGFFRIAAGAHRHGRV